MSRKPMRVNKSTLKELEQTWKRSREYGRGRHGFHEYLEAIYDSYAELRKTKGEAKNARRKIIKIKKLQKVRQDVHAIYVIIIASSEEDRRIQSRWAQALRYAWKWRKVRGDLRLGKFFKDNGGVAGCARKFSTEEKPELNRQLH